MEPNTDLGTRPLNELGIKHLLDKVHSLKVEEKEIPLLENRIQPVTVKARNPREELIEKFRDKLNADRIGTKYKPLSFIAVKLKVSHIKNDEQLYHFFRDCERAKHFSKYFFWALKPQ